MSDKEEIMRQQAPRMFAALEQSEALLERMVAYTSGEADFPDGALAESFNAVLDMICEALSPIRGF